MATELSGTKTVATAGTSRNPMSDAIFSGAESATSAMAGTHLLDLTPPLAPLESLGAFRGVAWSLAFEAGVVAVGFAIWQIWKMLE